MEILQLWNGSPSTKEETSLRLVGRMETQKGLFPQPHVVDKSQEGYLRSKGFQPPTRPPAQGSSARKISLHTSWLQKPAEIEAVEGRISWSPRQFLLKDLCTDLLRLTSSALQHRGANWKASETYREERNYPASGWEVGEHFLPDRSAG